MNVQTITRPTTKEDALALSLQDRQILADYANTCDQLNEEAERIATGKAPDGTLFMPGDVGETYYSLMTQCDRYLYYFSLKGLDANTLLEVLE